MIEPKEIQVLDHGFVRLIDSLPAGDGEGDARIVQAARVSYGAGTKTKREDAGLIRYLIKNKHWSPVEKVVFELHLKMPIFVARQFVRHRTQSLNEVSARYSVLEDDFYTPDLSRFTYQDTKNRQGSSDIQIPEAAQAAEIIRAHSQGSYERYESLLELGVSREIARVVLPVNIYTAWYTTMNLRNMFNFLELRLDSHAQYEARVYAEAMLELIKPIAPIAVKSWMEINDIQERN